MSVESQGSPASDEMPQQSDAEDQAAFEAMFDAYADHLFEYCNALLRDTEEAAAATQATFVMAYSLVRYLRNPERLEAWLYALARRECTGKGRGRVELAAKLKKSHAGANGQQDSESALAVLNRYLVGAGLAKAEVVDANTDVMAAISDADEDREAISQAVASFNALPTAEREMLEAFSTLPPLDRELINLVYWRNIDRGELPIILGVPARRSATMMETAERRFRKSAEAIRAGAASRRPAATTSADHMMAALQLARLPASVRRRTLRAVADKDFRRVVAAHAGPLDLEGFPAQPAPPGDRQHKVLFASAVGAPAAASVLVFTFLAGFPPVAGAPHDLTLASQGPNTSAANSPGAGQSGSHIGPLAGLFPFRSEGGPPVKAPTPTTGQQAQPPPAPRPRHHTSPPPTVTARPTTISGSPSPTPTPTPTPSPTTA